MTDGRSWEGNWKVRIHERLQERGFESLTAFADSRPAVPFVDLAEELGKDDVAGIQVLRGLLAEAERSKKVTRFVRDVFVRHFAYSLPDGWPAVMDDHSRFLVAKAIAYWSTDTPDTYEERINQARAILRANPPLPGWRPLGPDDELLLTLLPDEKA
ncbi:NUDIX hydrolase [Corallococcus sp. AB004]|uniref:NUDIX hydrolase n=1 Tax=Corallococcus exiguus TaxID=83462 RepID=UPI000EA1B2BE|nr:NUDIX hydrolase [Corallococcus exiguus]NPD24216.1 NUDIX hydrolase [Corallococcus exiguus]RKI45568.1 NUDIX hydrolase [Corallococcus sp. AB004]